MLPLYPPKGRPPPTFKQRRVRAPLSFIQGNTYVPPTFILAFSEERPSLPLNLCPKKGSRSPNLYPKKSPCSPSTLSKVSLLPLNLYKKRPSLSFNLYPRMGPRSSNHCFPSTFIHGRTYVPPILSNDGPNTPTQPLSKEEPAVQGAGRCRRHADAGRRIIASLLSVMRAVEQNDGVL